ncbi:hypothetical protein FB192DRAFT_1354826 [Mucor lusitanicus]|uniref:Uncharacterized protein n=1 Tax=Mucor circinelloides f. lusitanicus TaxID=29924 RepID=A0A8H4BRH3_MUCCL|nr:hypothetical protein FB192DRAFT_1354826 [Mucor lusitanicus]
MKISNSLLLLGAIASGILQVASLDVLITTTQSLASANDKLCITIDSCSYNCANFAAMPKNLNKPSNPSCSSASYPGSFAVSGAPNAPGVAVAGKGITCVKKKESGAGTITREFVCSYTPVVPATCNNKATIFGKKKKNGVLNDCCDTKQDCLGDCVSGKCGAPPATCNNKATIFGKKKKNGILNDCCDTKQDCLGDCVSGKCGKPVAPGKCTNKSYFGKRNGSGPNGVCCRTERDCKEDCISGVCAK